MGLSSLLLDTEKHFQNIKQYRESDQNQISPCNINAYQSEISQSLPPINRDNQPYGGITYLINSFDYPYLLCFNSPPTQHQFL